jgi:hypothetical protein
MSDYQDEDRLTRLSCHYDSMLWTVASLWVAAVGGLLVYSREHFDPWLAIFGLAVLVSGMFMTYRFRTYRRQVHDVMPEGCRKLLVSAGGLRQWDVLALIVLWLILLWARLLILHCCRLWPLWLFVAAVAAALVGIMWWRERRHARVSRGEGD